MTFFFLQSGGIVGQRMLQELKSIFSANSKAPHVRNIKKARLFAGDQMFTNNAGCIMQRHFPAGKFHHVRAQLDMAIVQRGFV